MDEHIQHAVKNGREEPFLYILIAQYVNTTSGVT